MHSERIKLTSDEVAFIAVGVGRTPYGNTHAGVVHRQPSGDVRFLEQAWHHDTRNDLFVDLVRYCRGACICVVPEIEPDRARNIAALCRLIARTGQMFAYALRHDCAATFEESTGRLVLPNGKGLNCSTFVLVLFHAARFPLVDLSEWPARDEDAAIHANLVALLEKTGAPKEHVEAVRKEVGCSRVRPEEVAGACLFDSLPVHFSEAEQGARAILEMLSVLRP